MPEKTAVACGRLCTMRRSRSRTADVARGRERGNVDERVMQADDSHRADDDCHHK